MVDETESKVQNKVTVEEAGPCKKKVTVEVPEKTVQKGLEEQYRSLQKEAIVPGFRKGRAPRRLLEKRFGKETGEKLKLQLLADASDSAIKEKELDTLTEPDLDIEKVELPESGDFKFDFEVTVKPVFELPELEGIPLQKQKQEVIAEQVKDEISRLQKHYGLWTPKEKGGVEADDQVLADVMIKVLDEENPLEEKLGDVEIHVRSHGFVGGIAVEKLDEVLKGKKQGDTVEKEVEVPKTHHKEEYKGKKVQFKIHIKDVKYLKPAELDESFFSRLGVADKKELEEKVKDMLESHVEQQTRKDLTDQVYKYMLAKTEFDLPEDIVAQEANTVLQRQYMYLLQSGLQREQIDEQLEELRAGSEEQAKNQLKTFFIMDKVAKQLDIDVTEEEVNGYIAQLALQGGQRPQKLREQMVREDSLGQLRMQVRENKCVSKLLESAKITETKAEKKEKAEAKKITKKKQVKKPTDKAASTKTKETTSKKTVKASGLPTEKTKKKEST